MRDLTSGSSSMCNDTKSVWHGRRAILHCEITVVTCEPPQET